MNNGSFYQQYSNNSFDPNSFEAKLSRVMGMSLDSTIMEMIKTSVKSYISLATDTGTDIGKMCEDMFQNFKNNTTMNVTESMELQIRWLFLQQATEYIFSKMKAM